MSAIDWIMELLKDGDWHTIGEIETKARIPNAKLAPVVGFLSKYGLVQVDQGLQKLRLAPKTRQFLQRIQTAETG